MNNKNDTVKVAQNGHTNRNVYSSAKQTGKLLIKSTKNEVFLDEINTGDSVMICVRQRAPA